MPARRNRPVAANTLVSGTRFAAAALLLTACSRAPEPALEPVFVDAAEPTGLAFTHEPGNRGDFYFPEIMGGGVALLDYDQDGDQDVFFVQSGFLGEPELPQPENRLFENRLEDGELRFVAAPSESGLSRTGYGMGVAVGDMDGDGFPDLYVTNFGANRLFRNNGGRGFTDITTTSGTGDERWTTSAVFFDADGDLVLDLYLVNYATFSVTHNKACRMPSGSIDYCGPLSYQPAPDTLYLNHGDGSFSDHTKASGLDRAYGTGLGVTASDFDGDGDLDLYVANDGLPNQLWLNKQGSFEDHGLMGGAAYNADGMTEASMGVTAGDFDGDGDDDLFMTHLRNETNTFYENDGEGNFVDITAMIGLGAPSRPRTGFGTAWFDYDNDGLLDLFVANGAVTALPQPESDFPYREPNQLFHNAGGKFVDVSAEAGPAVTDEHVSRGAAFGDIDNDGDTDIIVVNANGPAQLLLNQVGQDANWVGVDLREGGVAGHHAKVGVVADGDPIWRTSRRDGSYLSASDPRVIAGLGEFSGTVDVLIAWRDGSTEIWRDLATRRYHTLAPGTGAGIDEVCEAGQHAFCSDH